MKTFSKLLGLIAIVAVFAVVVFAFAADPASAQGYWHGHVQPAYWHHWHHHWHHWHHRHGYWRGGIWINL